VVNRDPRSDSDAALADLSELTVDRSAEVPLGVQLTWALRARIGDGRLQPGQRLPGLRELADTVGVNLNTVRTVYQRLEQHGLLETLQGSGTYVTGTAAVASSAGEIAAGAARAAIESGVSPRDVAAALYVSEPTSPTRDQENRRREAIRAEIATLERLLGTLEATHPGIVSRSQPSRPQRRRGPKLLSAEELEAVRSGLTHQLATVQAAIDRAAAERAESPRKRASSTSQRQVSEPTPTKKPAQPAAKKRRKPGPSRPATAGA
jgi:DNA-binding transcriptional regulator YhcF (GntR family)